MILNYITDVCVAILTCSVSILLSEVLDLADWDPCEKGIADSLILVSCIVSCVCMYLTLSINAWFSILTGLSVLFLGLIMSHRITTFGTFRLRNSKRKRMTK